MSGNRFQEHTATILMHSDDRVVQWEQLPVRLRRYEVTRYICPEIPGFTDYEDTIVGDDSTLMAEETLRISHEVLVSYPAAASFFSPILAAHGVSGPDQRDVARRVTDLALCMARSTVRPIAIYIMDVDTVAVAGHPYLWPVEAFLEEEEEEEEDVEDQTMIRAVPATDHSSIEQLEMVEVDGAVGDCSICLEELPMGMEVARMPCSHVFHSDCIVEWFTRRRICPLCGFRMPMD